MLNMFKCTLASGGALILTVTCDSVFAGQTITCTDGITTLTQICPSTSPYTVKFRIPNSGTWTISSGTDSTSVVITDAIELHNIPNGSTFTPTDNIQTWLHCANIWDKAYTTISDVLADGATVTALIASNNAVDYMARSNTWASSVTYDSSAMTKIGLNNYCADTLLSNSNWLNAICGSTYFESVLNVKVPTMTSNTTPSGQASANTTYGSGYEAYRAFDNNTSNTYYPTVADTAATAYLRYQFTQAVNVKKVVAMTHDMTAHVTYKIQYSDNGTSWQDASKNMQTTLNTYVTALTTSNTAHKYWQAKTVSGTPYISGKGGFCFQILQFYGRVDV